MVLRFFTLLDDRLGDGPAARDGVVSSLGGELIHEALRLHVLVNRLHRFRHDVRSLNVESARVRFYALNEASLVLILDGCCGTSLIFVQEKLHHLLIH